EMNVVLYIRVSSVRQVNEGHSLEGQLKDLRAYCSANSHTIVKEYIESGNSAYKGSRPILNQMLNEVTSRVFNVDAVVVYSLSRFARDLLYQLSTIKRLEDSGIRLFSATENLPEDDTTFKYLTVMLGLVNEMNSKQNGINVQSRLTQTAKDGYFTGGRVPLGYRFVKCEEGKKNTRKKLVIVEEEAAVVRKIFELSLTGTSGKGLGIKAIADFLNRHGFKYRGSSWSNNTVHKILTSTTYYGEFVFRKKTDSPIVISVPAIIDKNKFIEVRKSLKERDAQQLWVKAIRSNNLLTGLLKCGICGGGMTVCSGKSGRYKYYACTKKLKKSVDLCQSKWVPKQELDQLVESTIIEHVINVTNIQAIIDEVKTELLSGRERHKRQSLKTYSKAKSYRAKVGKHL
ncbi:TPA: recombinase family protein, partial [Vibrio parahaemolyticus]|nr:recombinase family protein [Vibrio parahaemolyticus]HBH7862102.1 recombinase family protein [Vibrio parahaemolyticus]HBH7902956.1 recombinase family protein [Vibrio parahaemolyticus]